MKRLAIVTTHPIQYNAPFFKKLAQDGRIVLKVFYTWDKGVGEKHDPGFGKKIEWDVPLLEGYEYKFVKNTSKTPGSHHFKGIQNPTLINEIQSFHPDAILVYGWSFQSHLKAMRYFKGKVPVWFRGDSTLLDYDYRSVKDIFRKTREVRDKKSEERKQKAEERREKREIRNNRDQKSEIRRERNTFFLLSVLCLLPSALCLLSSFFKFSIRRLFLTWVYSHIDKAFYVGTNNKNYFLEHRVKEKKLVWLPHAVDNDFFQKNEAEVEDKAKEWRRKLGIADENFVVLFAGKFEPKKNPELLVRAVMEMNEEIRRQKTKDRRQSPVGDSTNTVVKLSNEKAENKASVSTPATCNQLTATIHLILVGSGILEPQLTEMTKGKDYIHFLPFQNQSQMPFVYRLGNVFCLPSQGPGETWGLALNEALACGRPIIASHKVGCATDLIVEGKTGFMFHSQSNEDLKLAFEKMVQTEDLGQQCKDFIKTWEYNGDALFAQFNE